MIDLKLAPRQDGVSEFPMGVYDTNLCGLVHIGFYVDEAACWEIFLGFPDKAEINDAKARGLKVLPIMVGYDPR